MKTAYLSRQWHDLETLREVSLYVKEPTNYKSKFTSVERISEIQEIVHLTTSALKNYSIENEDTCIRLRNELLILRSYLVGLVGEFEDSLYAVEALAQSLHVCQRESTVDTEISTPKMENTAIAVTVDLNQSIESINQDNFSCSNSQNNTMKSEVRSQKISENGKSRERFVDLLTEWKNLGYEIDWHADEGYWQASINCSPDDQASRLMSKLVEYGVKLNVGNSVFDHPRLHDKKMQDSCINLINSINCESDFHSKSCSTSSVDPIDRSENYLYLLDELRQRGYKLEKQVNGKWMTSLSDYPDEDTNTILLKLLEFGLEIWPGRRFIRC